MRFKTITLVILFIGTTLLTSCHKDKPTGPYDPYTHISIFKAKIDNIDFEPISITISIPDIRTNPMGVFAYDNTHLIGVFYPRDCGEKTFNLSNSNQNASILFDNIECKTGNLTITKYDVNLVEGTFEFEVNIQDSVMKITEGFFSIVYPIN